MSELLFWGLFLFLNAANYSINYFLYGDQSSFFPYIKSFMKSRRLGLAASTNLDPFRYSVELSFLLIASRVYDLRNAAFLFTVLTLLILIFNLYQYAMRRIYESEPNIFNDSNLIKNAIAILWAESKMKLLISAFFIFSLFYGCYHFFSWFLKFNDELGTTPIFAMLVFLWIILPIYSVIKFKGFYKKYPNDIYLRYHFTLVELGMNIKRSFHNYSLSKKKIGRQYSAKRALIDLGEVRYCPNIYFFFIESYGSFFYREKTIRDTSFSDYENFQNQLKEQGFYSTSAFSKSTTTGGQSWLTYSSALFGYRIDNNTLFENHLRDTTFRNSNSLLKLLKHHGYTNYNLNPINPIDGINVPYDEMREMYAIDRWILSDDIQYNGNEYGFGACAPDQYSLNFTMGLIKEEAKKPYTLFYLTKNSHSPFITPPVVQDWRTLNDGDRHWHIHKGFLKYPQVKDYQNAIRYEFEVLQRFMVEYGTDQDLFVLIGDHQPPMLAKLDVHGSATPMHIMSKNQAFIDEFNPYGFKPDLKEISNEIRHEAFYSIFLNAFANQFSSNAQNIPPYEPEGIKL